MKIKQLNSPKAVFDFKTGAMFDIDEMLGSTLEYSQRNIYTSIIQLRSTEKLNKFYNEMISDDDIHIGIYEVTQMSGYFGDNKSEKVYHVRCIVMRKDDNSPLGYDLIHGSIAKDEPSLA